MFFLLKEDWSPRFENFFTVTITTWTTYNSAPASSTPSSFQTTVATTESSPLLSPVTNMNENGYENRRYNVTRGGSGKFPAVFYNIRVQCGREERLIPRRYSQFRSLQDEIDANPSPFQNSNGRKINLPPRTCICQTIDDDFLDDRQEELYHFLTSLLISGNANHPAMVAFLELACFSAALHQK